MEDFLKDAGILMSQHMDQLAARALSRLARVCRRAIHDRPVDTSIEVMGSHLLKSALPGLSDLDVVVMLQPRSGDANAITHLQELAREKWYLQCVATALSEEFANSKAGFHPGGGALVLTIHIPKFSSLDIPLCCLDFADRPIDKSSRTSLDATEDGGAISKAFLQHDLKPALQGAVRVIKLWAHRRNAYGSVNGCLGGSGWAVCFLRCVESGMKRGEIVLDLNADDDRTSQEPACFFFETTAKIAHFSNPIVLVDSNHEFASSIGSFRPGTR